MTRQRTPERLRAIGQRLKMVRESLGLTQRQICELLDVQPATWNHWETGRRLPDPVVVAELAVSHGVSLDRIYGGQQVGPHFSSEQVAAVGQRLRAIRVALELPLRELADILEVRVEMLEGWEYGRSLPGVEAMTVLSSRFGIPLDWTFLGNPACLPHRIAKKVLQP